MIVVTGLPAVVWLPAFTGEVFLRLDYRPAGILATNHAPRLGHAPAARAGALLAGGLTISAARLLIGATGFAAVGIGADQVSVVAKSIRLAELPLFASRNAYGRGARIRNRASIATRLATVAGRVAGNATGPAVTVNIVQPIGAWLAIETRRAASLLTASDADTTRARPGVVAHEWIARFGIRRTAAETVPHVRRATGTSLRNATAAAGPGADPAVSIRRKPRVTARAGIAAFDAFRRVEQRTRVVTQRKRSEMPVTAGLAGSTAGRTGIARHIAAQARVAMLGFDLIVGGAARAANRIAHDERDWRIRCRIDPGVDLVSARGSHCAERRDHCKGQTGPDLHLCSPRDRGISDSQIRRRLPDLRKTEWGQSQVPCDWPPRLAAIFSLSVVALVARSFPMSKATCMVDIQ